MIKLYEYMFTYLATPNDSKQCLDCLQLQVEIDDMQVFVISLQYHSYILGEYIILCT